MAEDPSLDFLSPQFDAARALHAAEVKLPMPGVPPCDNLDMYESLLRGVRRPFSGAAQTERKGAEVGVAAGPTEHDAEKPQLQRGPKIKTILWFMETPDSGPISLLQRCHNNKERVRVWIRHCAGVRGVCEGVVLAFDRHFNLVRYWYDGHIHVSIIMGLGWEVLGDVDEEWTPFRSLANGGRERSRKKRKKKKPKDRTTEAGSAVPPPTSDRDPSSVSGADSGTSNVSTVLQTDNLSQSGSDTAIVPATIAVETKAKKDSPVACGPRVEPSPGGPSSQTPEGGQRERLTRHVSQLFIRGDNVVLIALAKQDTH